MLSSWHGLVPISNKFANYNVIKALTRQARRYSEANTSCKEIAIPSPWGKISGKWWGSQDSQPILSVHGWEDNAGSFDKIAPLLEKSVLAIDLPGHGYSPLYPPATTYNFMDGVTLVRHVVRHFRWQQITLMGHSYGGAVAYAYAAFFPETVNHLIGIECLRGSIALKSESVSTSLRNTIEFTLSPRNLILAEPPVYTWDEMVELMRSRRGKSVSKETCECLLKRCSKRVGEEKYVFVKDPRLEEMPLGRMTDDMLFACASRINCKVLSILADPGLNLAASGDYKETANLMRKSASIFEEHKVQGSHHVHVENPDEVAHLIVNFIRN